MKKYSVRRPGCTSWTDTNSLKVARKEQDYANKNIESGHLVINNETGETEKTE